MIIDDSVSIKGTAAGTSAKTFTTADCIDRAAAGSCLCAFPTFVCYMTTAAVIATGTGNDGSFTIQTCDTENGTYRDVMTVYIPNGKIGGTGVVAKLDLPVENLDRYIKFRLDLRSNPTTAGAFDVLVVPGAARDK